MTTSNAIATSIPTVSIVNNQAKTSSKAVAEFFGKRHSHILEKIESLDCSPEFASANFSAHVEIIKAGAVERESKYYEMTKNGFVFLVMGFTGKRAAQFKEAYIARFDEMETALHNPLALTDGQHYVVAKDGVVIYHKVLSDRTAKNYLQPTIEHQASIVIDIPRENVKHNNTLMPNLHTLNTLYDGYGINGNPLVRLFATLIQAQKDGKPITVKDVSGARLVYDMTEALARQYNQALDNIKRAADNAYSSGMFLPIK